MPIRVVVPLPGPFVWTPRGRSKRRSSGSGSEGASGEEILVGIFLMAIFAGWMGIYYGFQHSVWLGVLAILADLAWLALLGRGWMALLRNDEIEEDEKTVTTAVVAFFAVGLPVLWLNGVAWWIPPLGVAANLVTIVAVAYALRGFRRWQIEQQQIAEAEAEAEADAAEVAALQAEIDTEEAARARQRAFIPPQPRRWTPPGYEQRGQSISRSPQGFPRPPHRRRP